MKKQLLILVITFFVFNIVRAQTAYTSTVDADKVIVLNGIVEKADLKENAALVWYTTNQAGYTPAPEVVSAMQAGKNKVQFLIFGGTWCSDTQNILPKFFKLQELSGIDDKDVSFIAVDHKKQTFGNLASTFKVVNVPTIIVLKDGKEVGRVVEYGKTGKWDKEVADLIK